MAPDAIYGMSRLVRQLGGGDRRSIGRADAVVRRLLSDNSGFAEIVAGLSASDALLCMRCADVAEKVSSVHPEWREPYKKIILDLAECAEQKELRWHLAQIVPRLRLAAAERAKAVQLLFGWLDDPSKIVKTFALDALAGFAQKDANLRRRLKPLLENARRSGSPAMRVRASKLLHRLYGSRRARTAARG
jgi:hypothetical protein